MTGMLECPLPDELTPHRATYVDIEKAGLVAVMETRKHPANSGMFSLGMTELI